MQLLKNPYIFSIAIALLVFPFVAMLITLPFAIANYRKYGGISILKTIIFYSFILYLLCVFLLTALPLPSRQEVLAMDPIGINFIPFSNLREGLVYYGMTSSPATWTNTSIWLDYLRSKMFFQIVANIVMTIPLGIYLRYYFGFSLRKTVLFGFLASLFLEATQLSGLWFIYPRPYRCPDVNDLMVNTLGALIGYLIAPFFTFFLPKREELDLISWRKGDKATIIRQIVATAIDFLSISLLSSALGTLIQSLAVKHFRFDLGETYYFPLFIFYFIILQRLLNGITFGKYVVRLKAISTDNRHKTPTIFNYLVRYFLIYFLIPLGLMMIMFMLLICIILFMYDNAAILKLMGILGTGAVVLAVIAITFGIYKKHKLTPWDYFSKIRVVVANRPKQPFSTISH